MTGILVTAAINLFEIDCLTTPHTRMKGILGILHQRVKPMMPRFFSFAHSVYTQLDIHLKGKR